MARFPDKQTNKQTLGRDNLLGGSDKALLTDGCHKLAIQQFSDGTTKSINVTTNITERGQFGQKF